MGQMWTSAAHKFPIATFCLPISYSELMIHDALAVVMAIADVLEVPVMLYDIFSSKDSPDPARQLGDSELVYRISTHFESPISQELLDYMKDMGRITSDSTLAYKWALEQSKPHN
jgi:hypothetical protein